MVLRGHPSDSPAGAATCTRLPQPIRRRNAGRGIVALAVPGEPRLSSDAPGRKTMFKLLIPALAIGLASAYYISRNRKLEFDLKMEPKEGSPTMPVMGDGGG